MDAKELQRIKDEEYAKSLGYDTDIFSFEDSDELEAYNDRVYDDLEWEMTHLFDYKEKTKAYLKSMK